MSKKEEKQEQEEKFGKQLKTKHNVSINNFWLMQEVEPEFFNEKKKSRLYCCFSLFDILNTKKTIIDENKEEKEVKHKHLKVIEYCKQSFCSCCNTKKGLRGFGLLKPILDSCGATELWFITLTFPNIDINTFNKDVFKKCSEMFFYFAKKSNKRIIEIFKNNVRKTESTINYKENQFNLHYHLMVGCNIREKDKKLIKYYGTRVYKKFFPEVKINTKDGFLNVDIRKVDKAKISYELTGYVSKASIDSIAKEDILLFLQEKIRKYKKLKKPDKQKHFEEQYAFVQNMTQEQISKIHAKWFIETQRKNFFNISGFKEEKKINEMEIRIFYNKFSFDSFQSVQNGEELEDINDIVQYFQTLFHRQQYYNRQRKEMLSDEEIFELLFGQAPFFVPEHIRKKIKKEVVKLIL